MVDFSEDIKACITVLERGGVILYPTDTVWGLGCDATNEKAVDAVFRIKNRPAQKSLIVLLAESRDVLRYVASPPPDIISIIDSFTVPTTVIFDDALGFAENAVAEDGSIAIRIPQDQFCKALLKRFRRPIISTSANISGSPAPSFFREIEDAVKAQSDYIVNWRKNDDAVRQPSRIVRLDDDGAEVIIRQ